MLRYKTGVPTMTAIIQYSTGGSDQCNKIKFKKRIVISLPSNKD